MMHFRTLLFTCCSLLVTLMPSQVYGCEMAEDLLTTINLNFFSKLLLEKKATLKSNLCGG